MIECNKEDCFRYDSDRLGNCTADTFWTQIVGVDRCKGYYEFNKKNKTKDNNVGVPTPNEIQIYEIVEKETFILREDILKLKKEIEKLKSQEYLCHDCGSNKIIKK